MIQETTISSEVLARVAVEGLQEKKAVNIVMMDLRDLSGAITDFFVVCSGTSDRHVTALSDSVEDFARKQLNDKPINTEGRQLGEWVLMDYVNVVVHIFQQEKREFFDIEGLWGDAKFEKFD